MNITYLYIYLIIIVIILNIVVVTIFIHNIDSSSITKIMMVEVTTNIYNKIMSVNLTWMEQTITSIYLLLAITYVRMNIENQDIWLSLVIFSIGDF